MLHFRLRGGRLGDVVTSQTQAIQSIADRTVDRVEISVIIMITRSTQRRKMNMFPTQVDLDSKWTTPLQRSRQSFCNHS